MSASAKTYSRRLFLTYQQVIEGKRRDLDKVVADFARSNKGVDLEQKLSFAEWIAETAPTASSTAQAK